MRLNYTQNFLKNYKLRIVRNKVLDKRFQNRLQLFLNTPQNPILRDHKLIGAKKSLRSFSVSGDIRVVYYKIADKIILIDVGSHN